MTAIIVSSPICINCDTGSGGGIAETTQFIPLDSTNSARENKPVNKPSRLILARFIRCVMVKLLCTPKSPDGDKECSHRALGVYKK